MKKLVALLLLLVMLFSVSAVNANADDDITLKFLSEVEAGQGDIELAVAVSPEIKNASIVMLTVLPILVVYPFMQKYFVKGTMVGAVKG